jgi:hypothetical protein
MLERMIVGTRGRRAEGNSSLGVRDTASCPWVFLRNVSQPDLDHRRLDRRPACYTATVHT